MPTTPHRKPLFVIKTGNRFTIIDHQTIKGFSLIELLVTLTIITILAFIALPSATSIKQEADSKHAIKTLKSALDLAKVKAITDKTVITVCALGSDNVCSQDWHKRLAVFEDKNRNGKLDHQENMVLTISPVADHGTLSFYSAREAVQFNAKGFPNGTFGSFSYCPNTKKERLVRKLVLNMQGQIKHSRLTLKQQRKLLARCKNLEG